VRVRGRSGGGLLLPAMCVWLANLQPDEAPDSSWNAPVPPLPRWQLRAFASRDGDRTEAVRQLVCDDSPGATDALDALLHADCQIRITAMDSLVRRQAAGQWRRILAAAEPDHPGTVAMAREAILALWPWLPANEYPLVRAALQAHASPVLRQLAATPLPVSLADARWPAMAWLSVIACGLLGFWLRERVRSAA
jgi:hypothetical protein